MGQKRNSYKVFGRSYEEKQTLRGTTFRWNNAVE
jgi:hypothetical protein